MSPAWPLSQQEWKAVKSWIRKRGYTEEPMTNFVFIPSYNGELPTWNKDKKGSDKFPRLEMDSGEEMRVNVQMTR